MVRVSTWNVNSIRARLPLVIRFLEEERPDIALFQEIKCEENAFPYEPLEELGYNIAIYGQKSYNGVAILSRFPLEDVVRGFPSGSKDTPPLDARYIEAVTGGVRVSSIYVPNGQEVGHSKYFHKKDFLERLGIHLQTLLPYQEPLVLGGDFNVALTDCDVFDPEKWHEKILCSTQERAWLRQLLYWGLIDPFQEHTPPSPYKNRFTWWDYRSGGWPRREGLRIDYLLLSSQLFDKMGDCGVLEAVRGWRKSSDHAPLWCRFNL